MFCLILILKLHIYIIKKNQIAKFNHLDKNLF